MLVLVVALVTAAGVRLFQPAAQWSDFYLGTYTQCLLDSGELPRIAGGDPKECDDLPGNPSNGSSTSADGNKGKNDDDSNKDDEQGKENSKKTASNNNANSDSSSSGSSNRNSRPYRQGGQASTTVDSRVGKGGTDTDGGEAGTAGKEKSKYVGASTSAGAFAAGKERRVLSKGISGLLDSEKNKIKQRQERISKAGEVDPTDFRKQKKLTLKPPERKLAQNENEDQGFKFGGLLRMIIIISIIVIMLVVLGSQLNSISKSMDK